MLTSADGKEPGGSTRALDNWTLAASYAGTRPLFTGTIGGSKRHTVLDLELMNARLSTLLAPLAAGATPEVVAAELAPCAETENALVKYRVRGLREDVPPVVWGKIYGDPFYAAEMVDCLEYLWSSVFPGGDGLGVPRPLGYLPGMYMLVYSPQDGAPLADYAQSSSFAHYITLAARWAAVLHASGLRLRKGANSYGDRALPPVDVWATTIAQAYPVAAHKARTIARHLAQRARDLAFDTDVPVHGDFHHAHMVIGKSLCVNDFEHVCMGDPNMDIASFVAALDLLASRKGFAPGEAETLQSLFLESYARATGWTLDGKYLYFYALSCLRLASETCPSRQSRPGPEKNERRAEVEMLLERGLKSASFQF